MKGLTRVPGGIQLAYGRPIVAYIKLAEAARVAREAQHPGDETGGEEVAGAHELFARDVRLVFQNCQHYNEDGSVIHEVAGRMLELFEKYFLRWVVQLRPLDPCTDDEEDDDVSSAEAEGETGGEAGGGTGGSDEAEANAGGGAPAEGESESMDVGVDTPAANAADPAAEMGVAGAEQAVSSDTDASKEAAARAISGVIFIHGGALSINGGYSGSMAADKLILRRVVAPTVAGRCCMLFNTAPRSSRGI